VSPHRKPFLSYLKTQTQLSALGIRKCPLSAESRKPGEFIWSKQRPLDSLLHEQLWTTSSRMYLPLMNLSSEEFSILIDLAFKSAHYCIPRGSATSSEIPLIVFSSDTVPYQYTNDRALSAFELSSLFC
jgi:hypothetical protein